VAAAANPRHYDPRARPALIYYYYYYRYERASDTPAGVCAFRARVVGRVGGWAVTLAGQLSVGTAVAAVGGVGELRSGGSRRAGPANGHRPIDTTRGVGGSDQHCPARRVLFYAFFPRLPYRTVTLRDVWM